MEKNYEIENQERAISNRKQKKFSIFAMFLNRKNAKNVIKLLQSHGYSMRDISLLTPEKNASHDFVYKQRTSVKMGAPIGALSGFIVLGLAGFLIGLYDPMGIGNSSLIIYTVVGILVGTFFGLAGGAFVGVGIPKSAAKRYGFYLKEGGIVVMVHLRNEEDSLEANAILEKAGGQDIVVLEESQIWSTIMPEKKRLTFH